MEMRQADPSLEPVEVRRNRGDMSKRRQNVSETDETGATVA
jgi:hypothetical protein